VDADTNAAQTGADNGDDIFTGTDGADTADGLRGDDSLFGGAGNDQLIGGDGEDLLEGGSGKDVLDGGKHDDTLLGGQGNDTLRGGEGDDTIDGGADNDVLDAGDGDDHLMGGDGKDRLKGGDGNDALDAGEGNDKLDGGKGDDTVLGGAGNDKMLGGAGNDALDGGVGDDNIQGGKGDDTLVGEEGNDTLVGGEGSDSLQGGTGDDTLKGGAGNDMMDGGTGGDVLVGGKGNDILDGGEGDDQLKGDKGDDVFVASGGNDAMDGGANDDRFDFEKARNGDVYTVEGGKGKDTIDLSAYDTEQVHLSEGRIDVDMKDGGSFSILHTNVERVTIGQTTSDLVSPEGTVDADTGETVDDNGVETGEAVVFADAGVDQNVTEGAEVTLDATQSSAFEEDEPLSYSWTQVGGPAVTLAGTDGAQPIFSAPAVDAPTIFTFEVSVTKGQSTTTDVVTVTVTPSAETSTEADDEADSDSDSSAGGSGDADGFTGESGSTAVDDSNSSSDTEDTTIPEEEDAVTEGFVGDVAEDSSVAPPDESSVASVEVVDLGSAPESGGEDDSASPTADESLSSLEISEGDAQASTDESVLDETAGVVVDAGAGEEAGDEFDSNAMMAADNSASESSETEDEETALTTSETINGSVEDAFTNVEGITEQVNEDDAFEQPALSSGYPTPDEQGAMEPTMVGDSAAIPVMSEGSNAASGGSSVVDGVGGTRSGSHGLEVPPTDAAPEGVQGSPSTGNATDHEHADSTVTVADTTNGSTAGGNMADTTGAEPWLGGEDLGVLDPMEGIGDAVALPADFVSMTGPPDFADSQPIDRVEAGEVYESEGVVTLPPVAGVGEKITLAFNAGTRFKDVFEDVAFIEQRGGRWLTDGGDGAGGAPQPRRMTNGEDGMALRQRAATVSEHGVTDAAQGDLQDAQLTIAGEASEASMTHLVGTGFFARLWAMFRGAEAVFKRDDESVGRSGRR